MAKKAAKNTVVNSKNSISKSTNNHRTRFTLYNLAGKEKAYYLVDKVNLQINAEISEKAVAHSIIIIDRSGSMSYDIAALKDTLIKLLTLDEYINFQLVITLISYSSKKDVTCHFQRVPIQEVMKQNSPYLEEIKKITATYLTCISQGMQMAKSLIKKEELTAITLHSDGYANDSSPSAEAKALLEICEELKSMDVFVNTIAYSNASDFKLLSKIANTVSGVCIKAGDVKEVYNAIYSTSKLLGGAVAPAMEETLAADYSYQVFFSRSANKINGTNQTLKIFGIKPEDDGVIYKYKQISQDAYEQLKDVAIAQNDESVYVFAKANLAEGNLNTAKYAIASTFNATLTERHAKALTNQEIANFAQDIEIALFYPNILHEHEILDKVKVNNRISLLELIKIFEEYRSNIIINLKHLQDNYQRKGIKRVNGVRDENGNLVKPWLTTEYIDIGEYVGMGGFEINHNTATINMLVSRKVKLVKSDDKTPIIEVAGLLVNDLAAFNNYTIVSDGEVNVKSLKVKISNKKAFDLLKKAGILETDKFDFKSEYTINLENLPLVSFDERYSSIDDLFYELAQIKVLCSILSAHLKEESDVFLPEQLDELKKHYLSKNLYINFPTTNEYTDIQEAVANGTVDLRVSYKIDIGSKDILNFGKLHSANKFLDRMYQVYDKETGEIFVKPTFEMALNENIAFRHKQLSSRTKITRVDDLMKLIFDDFLGLEDNQIVAAILSKIGADSLIRVLHNPVSKEETITAFTAANKKLEKYAEKIYREKISPLVFYIGSTGLLPDEMSAKAMTAEELALLYPNLQFSAYEQEGTFFEVGESIISVYAQTEYYSKKITVGVEE
ncbi:VWA domain-containing protein [Plectonema radiosum NIES-515]|uniref:VWA domain-containing protein n=1 Tax=Plectonema radiosum NIES-515 TaxID=2986073 RepID=A0ABT3B2W4_9CYAN|nr:vWA domain-containing protein [Plectonema radiosum]MCV3215716.1 VWA domain-containing protein [Plectonema radiosum NIES-515]